MILFFDRRWLCLGCTSPSLSFRHLALTCDRRVRGPLNQLFLLLSWLHGTVRSDSILFFRIPEFGIKILQTNVSINRIDSYLKEDDVAPHATPEHRKSTSNEVMGFENATLQWHENNSWKLKDLTIEFPRGELTVICGPTAAGKSASESFLRLGFYVGLIGLVTSSACIVGRDGCRKRTCPSSPICVLYMSTSMVRIHFYPRQYVESFFLLVVNMALTKDGEVDYLDSRLTESVMKLLWTLARLILILRCCQNAMLLMLEREVSPYQVCHFILRRLALNSS